MGKDLHYFLSDVTKFPVTFEVQDDDHQLAKGLPVVRPGIYHERDFSATALRKMADNFATIRDRDGFVPLLTPRHFAEPDEALGPITALRFDEENNALVADAVVGNDTVDKIKSKQYRYISGEFDFAYELAAEDQKNIGPAVAGVAWTTYPASRGMQIDTVLNAHEFPQLFGHPLDRLTVGDLSFSEFHTAAQSIVADWSEYQDTNASQGTFADSVWIREVFDDHLIVEFSGKHYKHNYRVNGTDVTIERDRTPVKQQYVALQDTRKSQMDGGDNMSLKDKVMALLGRAREGEEVTEDEVVALAAEVGTEDTETGEEEDTPTIDLDQLNRQLEEQHKATEQAQDRIVVLETARMRDKCQLQVDELVRGGHVPPAQRQQVYLMLEKLSADAGKLIVLGKDAKGEETTSEQTPLEVYVNTLKGMGLAEKTPEVLSGGFFEEEVLNPESVAAAEAVGKRIVEAIPSDQRKETEKTE